MEFLRVWDRIRNNTLLDQSRLYELWELIAQVAHLDGDILEVGVWRGGSAALMGLRDAAVTDAAVSDGAVEAGDTANTDDADGATDSAPPGRRTLFLADTFSGVAKAGERDPYYRGGEHADTSLDSVGAFLHSLALQNFKLLEGVFPEDTAHRIANRKFVFCHIDVDVYQSAKDVFEWVWPRIPPGGIIVFDDYGFYGCEGVTALIHELRSRTDGVVIGNLNGHAVIVRTQERGVHHNAQ